MSLVLCLALSAILILSATAWRASFPLIEESLTMIGFPLIGIGVIGRIWCGSYIAGFKNQTLMTQGPYSITRNPLYLFSFVGALGVLLSTETLTWPLLFIAWFVSYYPGVMVREEETLWERHGAAYGSYVDRVPLFFPKLRLYEEPDSYTISAKHFRRCLTDVVWFIVAAGAIVLLEDLHATGFLPTLFHVF
jgi:protein-S-isoprenylcysteine O-methyltransferase Ste14